MQFFGTVIAANLRHEVNTAHFLLEPQRSQELSRILEKHVSLGQLSWAQEIAKLLGRSLTPLELSKIIEKCLENKWFDTANEAAGLCLEPERSRVFSRILEIHVDLGHFNSAQEVVRLLNRNLIPKELSRIIKECRKRGRSGDADKAIDILLDSF